MPLIVTEYQSYIVNKEFERAEELLPSIPHKFLDKLAKFLDSIELKEEAFKLCQDLDHK